MSACDDKQDIKSLEKEVEQLRAEESQVRRGWAEMEGRYGDKHPLTGQHQAQATYLGERRSEAEKKLADAIFQEKAKDGLERGETERRRGGRGR